MHDGHTCGPLTASSCASSRASSRACSSASPAPPTPSTTAPGPAPSTAAASASAASTGCVGVSSWAWWWWWREEGDCNVPSSPVLYAALTSFISRRRACRLASSIGSARTTCDAAWSADIGWGEALQDAVWHCVAWRGIMLCCVPWCGVAQVQRGRASAVHGTAWHALHSQHGMARDVLTSSAVPCSRKRTAARRTPIM